MSEDALIGHTGFVGGNLLGQHQFGATYNSKNIEDIAGRGFDLIVCSGAPAAKWKANAEPEADRDNIYRLIRALDKAEAKKFVLISTVDVFLNPMNVDEESATPTAGLHAYGAHRRELEQHVAERFDTLIVRLPALYGNGLKKNAIFDLLNNNDVQKIDSRGVFQFYCVDRLWHDIEAALARKLTLVHLVPEPVSLADVAREAFDVEFTNEIGHTPVRYDVHTKYAEVFGGTAPYIEPRTRELASIGKFVERERARRV